MDDDVRRSENEQRRNAQQNRQVMQWFAFAVIGVALVAALFSAGEDDRPSTEEVVEEPVGAVEASGAVGSGGPYRLIPGTQMEVGPAPVGDPSAVVLQTVTANEQPCDRVTAARRTEEGSIIAACSTGDRYLVFDVKTVGPVALNCTAAKELLDIDAC